MSDTHDTDKVLADRLLAPPDAGAAEALRQRLFARTVPVLRRRRLARRLAAVATLAACYAAGLLSAHWLAPLPQGVKLSVVEYRPTAGPKSPEAPGLLERQARADAARRSALYRRAGDLYATEQGDLEAALRCYGRSLDDRPAEDLTIAPSDHWLLMAIKDAREKEKVYAKSEH
jgi:hypothetical protein